MNPWDISGKGQWLIIKHKDNLDSISYFNKAQIMSVEVGEDESEWQVRVNGWTFVCESDIEARTMFDEIIQEVESLSTGRQ